jgi:hypothetical protein
VLSFTREKKKKKNGSFVRGSLALKKNYRSEHYKTMTNHKRLTLPEFMSFYCSFNMSLLPCRVALEIRIEGGGGKAM